MDDEEAICNLILRALEKEGYSVTTTTSGEEALRIARKDKPSLVLLDLRMPGMDGLEVLRRLKMIDKEMVIIMVTAYGTERTNAQAMDPGAYACIDKPFDLNRLKEVVRDALL